MLGVFDFHGTSGRGYGQYRSSHSHPEGLCGECSQHLEVVCTVLCVVAVRLLTGHQASCLAGVVLLLTSSLRLILRSTRCEEGVGGLFGLSGQGATKIASGRLELPLEVRLA
eukprot:1157921-Pelagomonas_calceolata.AAC.7